MNLHSGYRHVRVVFHKVDCRGDFSEFRHVTTVIRLDFGAVDHEVDKRAATLAASFHSLHLGAYKACQCLELRFCSRTHVNNRQLVATTVEHVAAPAEVIGQIKGCIFHPLLIRHGIAVGEPLRGVVHAPDLGSGKSAVAAFKSYVLAPPVDHHLAERNRVSKVRTNQERGEDDTPVGFDFKRVEVQNHRQIHLIADAPGGYGFGGYRGGIVNVVGIAGNGSATKQSGNCYVEFHWGITCKNDWVRICR